MCLTIHSRENFETNRSCWKGSCCNGIWIDKKRSKLGFVRCRKLGLCNVVDSIDTGLLCFFSRRRVLCCGGVGLCRNGSFTYIGTSYAFIGKLADLAGNKKKFLVGFAGTGAVACAALGVPQHALAFLVVYVIAAIMLNGSMVFYDAFLIDATTEDRYDQVSSHGYAWGYIGSCIPFIACLAVVLGGPSFGLDMGTGMKVAFVITALWWIVFTIPLAKNVKQTHFREQSAHVFKTTFSSLATTVKSIVHNKRLLFFLVAFFFYIDGVHTVIKMSTSYGTDLGIDSTQLVLALLVTQFVAFPSAIAYGRLAKRFGTRHMLMVGVFAYFLHRDVCCVFPEKRN